ncbi:MAG: hypothetical protein ACTHOK_19760 [Nocardioidaceae bacterium]
MAINEWWAADPGQRFWMEMTDRDDLGADLFAPTTGGSGRPYWQADGGEVRWWKAWDAKDMSLEPIRIRYTLPSGGRAS